MVKPHRILLYLFKYRENFKGLYNIADIEIVIATMNRDNLDFLEAMFPFENLDELQILIINQTTSKSLQSAVSNIRVINSVEKGLSYSRNLGLAHAKGNLFLLTDDDVVFAKDFRNTILEGFSAHKNAAVVKFRVTNLKGIFFDKYAGHPKKRLSNLDILSTMSIELVCNKRTIEDSGVTFDIRFGLGAEFPLGEEQIFLKDLERKGYFIGYVPKVIARHPEIKNSDAISFELYWETMGALYTRMFKKMKYFWLKVFLFFKLKQGKLSFGSILKAVHHFRDGSNKFSKPLY